jgi:hypothetical protein
LDSSPCGRRGPARSRTGGFQRDRRRQHGRDAAFGYLAAVADVIGFCTPDQVLAVSEAVVTIQRDFGDRSERKHARLKYTIDDRGVDWFRTLLEQRLGFALEPARPFAFTHTGDQYGWQRTDDDRWHLTLFIENGRIADRDESRQLSGLRAIAGVHRGEFRLTANQNVVIAGVAGADRAAIDRLVQEYGLDRWHTASPLRLHSLACVGFPTCGLAMAESERYLPALVGRMEALLERHGLGQQAITLRMTGCPNGCARPYLAEIGCGRPGPVQPAPGRGLQPPASTALAESVDERVAPRLALFGAWAAGRKWRTWRLFCGPVGRRAPPARPHERRRSDLCIPGPARLRLRAEAVTPGAHGGGRAGPLGLGLSADPRADDRFRRPVGCHAALALYSPAAHSSGADRHRLPVRNLPLSTSWSSGWPRSAHLSGS